MWKPLATIYLPQSVGGRGGRPVAMPDSEEEEEEGAFQEELQQWRTSGDKTKTSSVKYTFKTLDELRGETHADQPSKVSSIHVCIALSD